MSRKYGHGPELKVDIGEKNQDSYKADSDLFIKDNIAIDSKGVSMRDSPKSFTVVYEELQLGEVIGSGASSVVLQAVHLPTGTPLALKVINMFDKSKRNQLIQEICTLYNADCPSLITFYGAFYREGSITIALEYMNGGSLANVLKQVGPVPESALANMTYQILWGLAYLKHEKRLHRDLKPGNLLINSKGEVKLTDFGVSRELQSSIELAGTFVGTFRYMSPERIRSRPYNYAADVWALGLCLIEAATGEYPYEDERTAIGMVETIVNSDIPIPDDGRFSSEFCEFLEQCLQKDSQDRLPAEALLGAPWLELHGARSYGAAVLNTRRWIEESA
uniref:mitogen-activated protein kinase kinase n=1 Tax=Heterosigma akashiwo TaxID=2829 RepID=A0A6V1SQ10_HETAK|mmetsp:Transcript_43885/g.75824  ORF Transcript_43885/g.75824 Transcript_43885/m.75824 type:complete len:334 (+) Transcript_43885:191-1192(+)|eukprot:CAMPEP_0206392286 /NCGR_PEP_ID=MMETSP0294-20121207/19871_1 /ASSEMBLY_ACC=CAM_ASM_000327 /TAXON_ID=39354 /ORGANISM="Heterosigma akashiwo, Strain CCMP2393" /LENGTH=333 /DNA_ID=CAMNT_0053845341 /DNA_START=176 /DNA_END=1177 /DNA_ORIENTATION=+